MPPLEQQRSLITALSLLLEREGPVSLHETHISWVLVGTARVWKLKKPLNLGFLDYSTLELRRHNCEQELLLNRRTLPELYRRVVPISGTPTAPVPDGSGDPIDYAVEMGRFDEADLLLQRLRTGQLEGTTIDSLADTIATLHASLAPAPAQSDFGTPAAVAAPMRENFAQISERLPAEQGGPLRELAAWTEQALAQHQLLLLQRKQQGHIRPCHGDLHLANIVLWQGQPRPFDCIEFNPDLSTIDTLSEVAFTRMDLQLEGRPDLAARLLNRYLEHSGDYAGLPLLPLYTLYRAMVRAKVAAIRLAQGEAAAEADYQRYLTLALAIIRPLRARLWLTHGPSGSGKSTLALAVVEQLGAVRLRADVERKRLFGLEPEGHSESPAGGGIYTQEATARTYARLAELAEVILRAGMEVVVDATCLAKWQRQRFIDLAERLGCGWQILALELPEAELRERIAHRLAKGRDPSEASVAVLQRQLATRQPLTATELAHTRHFSAARGDDVVAALRELAHG